MLYAALPIVLHGPLMTRKLVERLGAMEVYLSLRGAQNLRLAAEILQALPAHVGTRCYVKLSEWCICGDHMLDSGYDVKGKGRRGGVECKKHSQSLTG